MRRRFLSLLLTLALLLSLLPVCAEEMPADAGESAAEPAVQAAGEAPAQEEWTQPSQEEPAEPAQAPSAEPTEEPAEETGEESPEKPISLADILRFDPPTAFAPELLDIRARGAVVLDFDTGEIYYGKDADLARPVASMTKIMSLYLFFEAMGQGRFDAETPIPISEYAAAVSSSWEYSGKERFTPGEQVPAGLLIALILTASANASVIALAEYIDGSEAAFTQRMNARAAQWGLDAQFADCTGFESEGNAVSPIAMAQISRRLIADYPAVLDYATLPEAVYRGRSFPSTNRLLLEEAVEGIDGLKTGWTTTAGHCFTGTALREGRRIITVVMDAGSGIARMSESAKLLEYGFACRAAREAEWSALARTLRVSCAVEPAGFCAATGLNRCTLTFSGCEGLRGCRVQLEVDGHTCPLAADALCEGERPTFFYAPEHTGPSRVCVVVTLPNGAVLRRAGTVRMAPLSAGGRVLLSRLTPTRARRVALAPGAPALAG